jgi:hypothetical protein
MRSLNYYQLHGVTSVERRADLHREDALKYASVL